MANNKGRIINFVTGITGISPGGQAVINMPVNQRYHRMIFQCTALNFTGGTDIAAPALTGSGVGLTADVTVSELPLVHVFVPDHTRVADGARLLIARTLAVEPEAFDLVLVEPSSKG